MKIKFDETRIQFNNLYYSLQLIESSPSFEAKINEFYEYYRKNGCPIPDSGFKPPIRNSYHQWLILCTNKSLIPYQDKLKELLMHFTTENIEKLQIGLTWKHIFKVKNAPMDVPFEVKYDWGPNASIALILKPGITKDDYISAWNWVQFGISGDAKYKTKNKEWNYFERDMKIFGLYENIARKEPRFLKKSWESRLVDMQYEVSNPRHTNLYGYKISGDQLRLIIKKCDAFFVKNTFLKKDALF